MKKLFIIGLISLTVNAVAMDNGLAKQRSKTHWKMFLMTLDQPVDSNKNYFKTKGNKLTKETTRVSKSTVDLNKVSSKTKVNELTKKSGVVSKSKKIHQASPARNRKIFNNLLEQAEEQLIVKNTAADQEYAQKASWKIKDRTKQEMLGLNNQLDHKLDKKLYNKLYNNYTA